MKSIHTISLHGFCQTQFGGKFFFVFLAGIMLFQMACKKPVESETVSGIEWIHVLSDTIFQSTDNDFKLGINGKVLTDNAGNIFCYYYNTPKKQTVVLKLNSKGAPVMTKRIGSTLPSDMVLLNDGSLIVAGTDPTLTYKWNKFYKVTPEGSIDSFLTTPAIYNSSVQSYTVNINLNVMPAGNIIASTVSQIETSNFDPLSYVPSFLGFNSSFGAVWFKATVNNLSFADYEMISQNNIYPVSDNEFVYQFEETMDQQYNDSIYFGFRTGVYTLSNNTLTRIQNTTAYQVLTNGHKKGAVYRYGNAMVQDDDGTLILPVSGAAFLGNPSASLGYAFLRLNSLGQVTDTIQFSLPPDFRIFSCVKNNSNFLMSAYRSNIVDGSNDYSSLHTIFLAGNSAWQIINQFQLQNFYSDFFPSVAAAGNNEYVLIGKIQTFNGASNQLVIVKYKTD